MLGDPNLADGLNYRLPVGPEIGRRDGPRFGPERILPVGEVESNRPTLVCWDGEGLQIPHNKSFNEGLRRIRNRLAVAGFLHVEIHIFIGHKTKVASRVFKSVERAHNLQQVNLHYVDNKAKDAADVALSDFLEKERPLSNIVLIGHDHHFVGEVISALERNETCVLIYEMPSTSDSLLSLFKPEYFFEGGEVGSGMSWTNLWTGPE